MNTFTNTDWLNPGSPEARHKGCTCPIDDNKRGAGVGGDGKKHGWWMNADCPLHGSRIYVAKKEDSDAE